MTYHLMLHQLLKQIEKGIQRVVNSVDREFLKKDLLHLMIAFVTIKNYVHR